MNDNIDALRAELFAQMRELRATSTDDKEALQSAVRKSAAVSDLARAITETGRLSLDHSRTMPGSESKFLAVEHDDDDIGELPNGITAIVKHRLGR
jgi:hypothetical protein